MFVFRGLRPRLSAHVCDVAESHVLLFPVAHNSHMLLFTFCSNQLFRPVCPCSCFLSFTLCTKTTVLFSLPISSSLIQTHMNMNTTWICSLCSSGCLFYFLDGCKVTEEANVVLGGLVSSPRCAADIIACVHWWPVLMSHSGTTNATQLPPCFLNALMRQWEPDFTVVLVHVCMSCCIRTCPQGCCW